MVSTYYLRGNKMNSPRTVGQERRAALAASIADYMAKNMGRHVTINELSDIFHASPTQIKNAFRETYSSSVYAYSRAMKMQTATELLTSTDRTVLDIAASLGYDNGSKFAAAFKAVTGKTPTQYRALGKA